MGFSSFLPKCTCGADTGPKPLRVSRALFVSNHDGLKYLKKLHSREIGSSSNASVQLWKVSTKYNTVTQIYGERKQWFLGLPRIIYASLARLRALLNSIPQDSLVSGALWILFEIEAPEYIQQDMQLIIVSMLVHILETDHPTIDVFSEARNFIQQSYSNRSIERYIRDTKAYIRLRPNASTSHIIIRSFVYRGMDCLVDPAQGMPPLKIIVTVCNQRIGQLDQTYFANLNPTGGIVPINQSVNAADEIIFSLYLRGDLVARFQTVGFALIDVEKGPLKLLRDDLCDLELFKEISDESFFLEIFAECVQWMSEGGGTSMAQGTNFTGVNTMDDSEAILNVASRLQPQSGVELTMEEKFAIIMSALPTYPYKPLERQSGESDEEFVLRTQCQICLCDYDEGDDVRALPCMHAFHAACTESWLRVRIQCPNCLADLVQLLSHPGRGEASPQSLVM
jgi:hypothetical protein